jgi:hypothetical protein
MKKLLLTLSCISLMATAAYIQNTTQSLAI